MRLQIEVTEEDIREGKQGDRHCCPIARAVRRVTRGRFVEVDRANVCTGGDYFPTPRDVGRWIDSFDWDKASVYPFGFTLEVP